MEASQQVAGRARFAPELAYEAARLYYLDDETQASIAERLQVSRPTVSRLVAEARRLGLVRIEVVDPRADERDELAGRLADALHLQRVRIVPSVHPSRVGRDLAPAVTAELESMRLKPGDALLCSSGRTVYEIVGQPLAPLAGVQIAPSVGGLSEPVAWYQTNEITRQMAERTGAFPAFLYAEAMPAPALRRSLDEDPTFRHVTGLWGAAKGAIVGIGAPPTVRDSISRAIRIEQSDLLDAVGDVCLNFFDAEGRAIEFDGSERMVRTPVSWCSASSTWSASPWASRRPPASSVPLAPGCCAPSSPICRRPAPCSPRRSRPRTPAASPRPQETRVEQFVIGVDVGTSSTKGVLVSADGSIVRSAARRHDPDRPRAGHVEMDAELWWAEFAGIAAELAAAAPGPIAAVGVSGMGPCTLLTDGAGRPLRPAILYGIDTRASEQIVRLQTELGDEAIVEAAGSRLSGQSVGPKLAWVAEQEPQLWARAERLFMPSSWLLWKLTGEYAIDRQSASQAAPLYDLRTDDWHDRWADALRGGITLPRLLWTGEVAGLVTPAASAQTGLPAGIPVAIGAIDAWTEAVSVGADRPGGLMLMYGTTLFLSATDTARRAHPALWCSAGTSPGLHHLAAGMATSGAVTDWLRTMLGEPDFGPLVAEAEAVPVGSDGLLMLPYFAGERTPLHDPDARGVIAGLSLRHRRGHLYRAALEGTAFGVRHNLEFLREAGASITAAHAVGGGTSSRLWPQIVSDVTGLPQLIARHTIGACFGAAVLAARTVTDVRMDRWNPVVDRIEPDPANRERYDGLYADYRALHPATVEINHHLAALQREV
nr:FGGY family carbohydrate kinase [Arenivirga flava]